MKTAGILFFVVGALMNFGGAGMDVAPSDYGTSLLPSRVANLHALHAQALVLQGGFAAIIAGSILLGFGSVVEVVKPGRPAEDPADRAPVKWAKSLSSSPSWSLWFSRSFFSIDETQLRPAPRRLPLRENRSSCRLFEGAEVDGNRSRYRASPGRVDRASA